MTAYRTTSASSDHALANFCACTSGHSPVERRYWTSTNRRPSVSSNETTCLPMVSSDRESPGIAIMVPSGNLDSPPCARRETREVGSSDLFVEGGSAGSEARHQWTGSGGDSETWLLPLACRRILQPLLALDARLASRPAIYRASSSAPHNAGRRLPPNLYAAAGLPNRTRDRCDRTLDPLATKSSGQRRT